MRLSMSLLCIVTVITIFKAAESKLTLDQIKNTLKPFKNSCLKKTSPDLELVEGTKSGSFPDDRSLMCFMKCLLVMMKVMSNGEISLPAIMKQVDIMMPEEHVERTKEISTNCYEFATTFTDPCDSAFHFVKCFYEADSELYFFP